MPTPSYVAGTSAGAQSTSVTIAVPGSVSVDDVALLWMTVATADRPASNPAGWTQIGSDVELSTGTTKGTYVRLLRKVLQAGDIGANVVLTFSGQTKWSAVMAVYTDVDTTTPVHVSSLVKETVAGTTHSTPTPTVSLAGGLAVYGVAERGTVSTDLTGGTGITRRQINLGAGGSGNGSAAIGDSANAVSTGALTARTWTATLSTDNAATFAVVLNAAATTSNPATTRIPGRLAKTALDALIALGTPKAYLLAETYAWNEDDHDYLSDVSAHELGTGNGYTAGGQTLTNVSTAYDSAMNTTKVTSDPATWSQGVGQTLTAAYCAIVVWTGSAATSPILAIVDAGGAVDAQGVLVVTPDAEEGWLTGAQVSI